MLSESLISTQNLERSPLFNESPPSFSKEKLFNSTALINDYTQYQSKQTKSPYKNLSDISNTSDHKKKGVKENIFEKMMENLIVNSGKTKPILKGWKNPKFKKTKVMDQSTSMDCDMTIQTDFDKYLSLSPNIQTEMVR
jgi:hypothetical protein